MCTKYVHQICELRTCTMYAHKVCAPSIKTCALCTMHRSAHLLVDLMSSRYAAFPPEVRAACTKTGEPILAQVPQAWWAYSCPSAPANQVQSAITELICSTSMHCNGAKNIACLPTHGEANKSPDLRVGTITLDLRPISIDALDRPLCDKPSGWSRSFKKKEEFNQMVLKGWKGFGGA